MRTIQEVFNAVIDRGLYSIETNAYMCWAVTVAMNMGLITMDEHYIAIKDIEKYLNGWSSLQTALEITGLPWSFPDRLAIYKNWASRPQVVPNVSRACRFNIT